MALAATSRYTGAAAADTITSSSFTPSNNSLLVVAFSTTRASSGAIAPTISDTAGLAWTSRALAGAANQWDVYTRIWTAPVTTGVSMTVTCANTSDNNVMMSVVDFTGYDTGSPVGATGAAAAQASRSGAYALNLSGTTAADSIVIGSGTVDGPNTTTAGTGWTALYDGTPNYVEATHQYKAGAMATADWNAMNTSYSWAAVAIEVKADAGGGPAATSRPIFQRAARPYRRAI